MFKSYQGKTEKWKQAEKGKTNNKMADLSPNGSITALNINGLNVTLER